VKLYVGITDYDWFKLQKVFVGSWMKINTAADYADSEYFSEATHDAPAIVEICFGAFFR